MFRGHDTEHRIFEKINYMTMEQQAQVMRFIEEIEAADKLTVPRLIITNDWEFCRIWSKNDHASMSSQLGISPIKAFVEYMKAEQKLLIGEPTAAKVVEEIGSVVPLPQERTYSVKGRSLVTGLPAAVEISSIQVRDVVLSKSFGENFFTGLREFLNFTPFRHKISREELAQASIILRDSLPNIRGLADHLQEVTGLKVILWS